MAEEQIVYGECESVERIYFTLFEWVDDFVSKLCPKTQAGLLKAASQETLHEFRTLVFISSSEVDKDATDIEAECTDCFEQVRKKEIRKKALFINTQTAVYCLGGYLFDPIRKVRSNPIVDWKYIIRNETLVPITPVPGGRINFGCAANSGKICLIGGISFDNVPLANCFMYDVHENKWQKLPDLKNSTSWCGVTLTDSFDCIVVGGYNIKAGVPYATADCSLLRCGSREWVSLPDLQKAGCNMMTATDNEAIFVMGGRFIGPNGPGESIDDVYKLNLEELKGFGAKDDSAKDDEEKKGWIHVTKIPEYDIKNTNLVYDTDRIYSTERPKPSTDPDVSNAETITKFTYVFAQDEWFTGRKEAEIPASTTPDSTSPESTTQEEVSPSDVSASKKRKGKN